MDNYKTFGVTINGKHSYTEYGLILTSKKISTAEPQLKTVDVPGRNTILDLSEVATGNINFNPREIEITFFCPGKPMTWQPLLSKMMEDFQGQLCKIIFDDDLNYYWYGRPSVELEEDGAHATFTVTATVDPYKYYVQDMTGDWLWDPFDFENGIVNEPTKFNVSGTTTYDLVLTSVVHGDIPTFTSTAKITMTYNGTSYSLAVGTNKFYDIQFSIGENTMTFTGTGTIQIDFKGGTL